MASLRPLTIDLVHRGADAPAPEGTLGSIEVPVRAVPVASGPGAVTLRVELEQPLADALRDAASTLSAEVAHPVVGIARSGGAVVVIGDRRHEAVELLERLASTATDATLVRTNGREQLRFPSGGTIAVVGSSTSLRGRALDAALVTTLDAAGPYMADLERCMLTSKQPAIYRA